MSAVSAKDSGKTDASHLVAQRAAVDTPALGRVLQRARLDQALAGARREPAAQERAFPSPPPNVASGSDETDASHTHKSDGKYALDMAKAQQAEALKAIKGDPDAALVEMHKEVRRLLGEPQPQPQPPQAPTSG